MSAFLTAIDKGMTELATVSEMIMTQSMATSSSVGLPECDFDPKEGISICIPGNMMGFIKTQERYWQVVAYCIIRYYVLGELWHDTDTLDQACESFLRQTAERQQPRNFATRLWHRLTHRRNLGEHYLRMFREGRQIYQEYQSLL
jgi:hypothetical protein